MAQSKKQIAIKKQSSNASQIINKLVKRSTPNCNCKFCNSDFRAQAQMVYQNNGRNIKTVLQFLLGKGQAISYPAVHNHLKTHYGHEVRALRLQQYSQKMQDILSVKTDQRTSIQQRISIFKSQLIQMAALTNNATIQQKIKVTDSITKLSNAIGVMQNTINDMNKQMQPFYVLLQVVKQSISARVKTSQSVELKKQLMGLYQDIIDSQQIQQLSVGKRRDQY